MKAVSYAMMVLGCGIVIYIRGAQILAHPEWTEAQSLAELWPTYALAASWVITGALGLRLSARKS